MNDEEKRTSVRERYGDIAKTGSSCCGDSSGGSCCGASDSERISSAIGYSSAEIDAVPDGSNLGLGCGNPTAIAGIQSGETVLDLGSGAGFDCFLAAKQVGPEGRVIGVDMTPEMLERARGNAESTGYDNVEFRLGEIEHLPVADQSVDLIISNCVINLSPDKSAVFAEAYRVLKPGGRLMVSDIMIHGELPDAVREDAAAYSACVAGAIDRETYLSLMADAGFTNIGVESESEFSEDLVVRNGDEEIKIPEGTIVSASVSATRS